MPIQSDSPVVIPATQEKTFPHLWVYALNVLAPSPDSGRISIETLPYNGDTGEIGSGAGAVNTSTDKLWQAVAEVPEVAAAFGAILGAVQPLKAWIAAQEAAAQEAEPQP